MYLHGSPVTQNTAPSRKEELLYKSGEDGRMDGFQADTEQDLELRCLSVLSNEKQLPAGSI